MRKHGSCLTDTRMQGLYDMAFFATRLRDDMQQVASLYMLENRIQQIGVNDVGIMHLGAHLAATSSAACPAVGGGCCQSGTGSTS